MSLEWNSRPDTQKKAPLDLSDSGYQFTGATRYVYPLLYIPISDIPIDAKVALMKRAIEAGDDVNQLDPINDKRVCFGRPLNFAVEYSRANFDYLKDNIPVIKLLLEHGADPRLPGLYREKSALEAMREVSQTKISTTQPEWNKLVPFFQEAFQLMEEAAKRLDEQDAKKARRGRLLDGLMFWRKTENA